MLFDCNWIDLFMVLICGRVVYTGVHSTIPVEGLRLIGVFVATFITLHYYYRFAQFIYRALGTPEWMNVQIAIILLWLTVFIAFKLAGTGWSLILKGKPRPRLDKWGGGLIAAVRAVFICGLMYIALLASGNATITELTRNSYFARYLLRFSPAVYATCYDKFISKYFSGEKLNRELFDMLERPDDQPGGPSGKSEKKVQAR